MSKLGEFINFQRIQTECLLSQIEEYKCSKCKEISECPLECIKCSTIYCRECSGYSPQCAKEKCAGTHQLQKICKREQRMVAQIWNLIGTLVPKKGKSGEHEEIKEGFEGVFQQQDHNQLQRTSLLIQQLKKCKEDTENSTQLACAVCYQQVENSTDAQTKHRYDCPILIYWCNRCQKYDNNGKIFHLQQCNTQDLKYCEKCQMKGEKNHEDPAECLKDVTQYFQTLKKVEKEKHQNPEALTQHFCRACKNYTNERCKQCKFCSKQYCLQCAFRQMTQCLFCKDESCCQEYYFDKMCKRCNIRMFPLDQVIKVDKAQVPMIFSKLEQQKAVSETSTSIVAKTQDLFYQTKAESFILTVDQCFENRILLILGENIQKGAFYNIRIDPQYSLHSNQMLKLMDQSKNVKWSFEYSAMMELPQFREKKIVKQGDLTEGSTAISGVNKELDNKNINIKSEQKSGPIFATLPKQNQEKATLQNKSSSLFDKQSSKQSIFSSNNSLFGQSKDQNLFGKPTTSNLFGKPIASNNIFGNNNTTSISDPKSKPPIGNLDLKQPQEAFGSIQNPITQGSTNIIPKQQTLFGAQYAPPQNLLFGNSIEQEKKSQEKQIEIEFENSPKAKENKKADKQENQ